MARTGSSGVNSDCVGGWAGIAWSSSVRGQAAPMIVVNGGLHRVTDKNYAGREGQSVRESSWGHDEACLVGEDDQLHAVAYAQLGDGSADMCLGGERAHEQPSADLLIGQALGDQPD